MVKPEYVSRIQQVVWHLVPTARCTEEGGSGGSLAFQIPPSINSRPQRAGDEAGITQLVQYCEQNPHGRLDCPLEGPDVGGLHCQVVYLYAS